MTILDAQTAQVFMVPCLFVALIVIAELLYYVGTVVYRRKK